LRASTLVGLDTIDAMIRHINDEEVRAIQRIENVHREALDAAELLEAVKADLAELGKASAVAKRWEKTESWVSKVLALDNLGEMAQSLVAEGLSGDREVLTTVSRLERANPDLAEQLVRQIRAAPEGNVRSIVNEGIKVHKPLQTATDTTGQARMSAEAPEDDKLPVKTSITPVSGLVRGRYSTAADFGVGKLKLVRLPEEAFWQLAHATRLKDRGLRMAKAVLVDGQELLSVAAEFDVPRQYVYQSVQTIESTTWSLGGFPSGAWLQGEIEIPVEIAEDLQAVLMLLRRGQPDVIEATAKALAKLRSGIIRNKP
jgi:hypothetical protein